MKAIEISKNGGPEVLEIKDIKLSKPEEDEVTIEHRYYFLSNIIELWRYKSLPRPPMPSILTNIKKYIIYILTGKI